jgi:hypothetical protein
MRMEKNHETYIFSLTTAEGISPDEFSIDLYEYNHELCCDGAPAKVVKNFNELIDLLEQWEEQ